MNRHVAELSAFAAIAAHRSFRRAADELGVSPSTLSHMMRTLEAALGVRLLHRTTRSVAPTQAGARLLERLQPLLGGLDAALAEASAQGTSLRGRLRINASEPAVRLLMPVVIPAFLRRYPDIELDIAAQGQLVDIVAEGFDAGIRLSESVPQDMIAVRVGGPTRFISVASPPYLQRHGRPQVPTDLVHHQCIRFRLPSGKPFAWEFSGHGQSLSIDVPGALTLDHLQLMAEAAAQGLGIAYLAESTAAPWIADGRLQPVLEDWCPWFDGLRLDYPAHRQVPATLSAFIEVLREHPA